MWLIHRTREYERCKPGINWDRNFTSRFLMMIVLWRFRFYFRFRSKLVGGKRIILDAAYVSGPWLSSRGPWFEWDTASIRFGKDQLDKLSIEFFDDIAGMPIGTKVLLRKTDYGWVMYHEAQLGEDVHVAGFQKPSV